MASPKVKPQRAPDQQFFTTGTAAKVFQVAPRTITKWVDAGVLKGLRLPLSRDRRIMRCEIVRFAKERGFPLPAWLDPTCVPISVCCDMPGFTRLAPIDLGVAVAQHRVSVVLVGCELGFSFAMEVLADVRRLGDPDIQTAILLGDDRTPADVPKGAFNRVFESFTASEAIIAWANGDAAVPSGAPT